MKKLQFEELNRYSVEEFRGIPKTPVVLVLDNIRSALNVGSVFRTADAFALAGVHLCGITAQPPHREILKTAIGATESIEWKYFPKTADSIQELRQQGYRIIGIEQTDESIPLNEFKTLQQPLALVFGNEVGGLSDDILPLLDDCIEIPQYGTKHSLNVAVCVGIVTWHFFFRRIPSIILPLAAMLLAFSDAVAQPVTFSQGDLLHPVSGFAYFTDCVADMNGDLLDDVVRVGNKGIYIDYQQEDGAFLQKHYPLIVQTLPDWSICAGDLDNNGLNDLLFAGSASVSFVKADATGSSFEETLMPAAIFSQRSTMADIDNDGLLDAFVCHDGDQSIPFRNTGAGMMVPDTNLIHTADRPGNYAAIWTDYDNDGDTDLYITKCLANAPPGDINRTNLLYRNNGDGTFSEVGEQAGLDDNAQSWSTVFEDFDNDGDFDAFIVNHDFQNRLFRNNGDGTFSDVVSASGIDATDFGAWENASGDFNNDGFVDIFSELAQELYLGNGDLTFTGQDAPVTPGAIGDLNDDGFLDVMRLNQLWLNEGNANHWIKIMPLGISGNRNGIGARVEIFGEWGMQVREVRSGQSFSPMGSLMVHFGLGQSTEVDSLKIKWPSGMVTTLENLPADTTWLVPEAPCLLPATVLSIQSEAVICPGDTVNLLAPSGFSGYAWSNGQAGQILPVTAEGRYFAILTDSAGCISLSDYADIQFIEDLPPIITSDGGNTVCQGDTLLLTAALGENYVWSNGVMDSQTIAVAESGSYTVAVDALCAGGQLESTPFAVEVLPAPPPVISEVTIGQGDSVLLTAQGENCMWFDQPSGGNLLASGSMFQTPPLNTSTSYFVESHYDYPLEVQSGGKPDTTGQGGLPAQSGFLVFEAWQSFTLLSVSVYLPPAAFPGNRFIQLFSGDTLLAFKQFFIDTGFTELNLAFEIPTGKFSLHCPQGNLWCNTGLLDYPYPLGEVGQITTSSFGEGYYYYFYDWKIQTPAFACVSERVAVNVTVTGTKELSSGNDLRIAPNPAAAQAFVAVETSASHYSLFDAWGRRVLSGELANQISFLLDLSVIPPGVYYLQVVGEGYSRLGKLLKQ